MTLLELRSPRSLTRISLTLMLAVACGASALAQQTLGKERSFSTLIGTGPKQGDQGVSADAPIALRFTLPIDTATVDDQSFVVSYDGAPLPLTFHASVNRRTVWANFVDVFPPAESQVDVFIDGNSILDSTGLAVDADKDGVPGGTLSFSYFTGVGAPLDTAPVTITGYVQDENGDPLAGVQVDAVFYPSEEGEPPYNQPAISDANGEFTYETIEITGSAEFLVRQRILDGAGTATHTETLTQITLLAGSCWRLPDASFVPLSPRQTVNPGEDTLLCDPTGQVELFFPDGAISDPAEVAITVLPDASFLRSDLPQLVSDAGFFIDINGVFGDETDVPVTLTLPNTFGLPPGTQVQIGKVDHNTLEWVDMREAYDGKGPPPDFIGEVSQDGETITVPFDHFCTVCTGYCLPIPCDEPRPQGPMCDPPPDPDNPPDPWPFPPLPWCCGNSLITLEEGHLYEWIDLPGFTERGEPWALKLGYTSLAANPSVTISMGVDFLGPRPVERTIFSFTIEGLTKQAAYGRTSGGLQPRGMWFWDGYDFLGNELPTGSYQYQAQATSLNNNLNVALPNPDDMFGDEYDPNFEFENLDYPNLLPQRTVPFDGRVVVLNDRDSDFGAGWTVTNVSRLYPDPDGCLVHVYGTYGWRRYEPDPMNPQGWLPPDDLSLLTRDASDGSYRRALTDGTVETYDTNGLLQSIVTRDGYTTLYAHDVNGRLQSITSPTGFQYTFSYSAGKISQISDSAGRTTTFVVNGAGDLVSVTDATGSTRTFIYDEHRLVEQQGPRGERSEYDFENTRVVEARAYDIDGTTLLRTRKFEPSSLEGEMGQAILDGFGSLNIPIPPTVGDVDVSIDGNGRISRHYTDAESRTVRQTDPLGRDVFIGYDGVGNIASITRPDGARTEATYDAGNNPAVFSEYDENGLLLSTSSMVWSGPFGQLSETTDERGITTSYGYETSGNLRTVTDNEGNEIRYEYGDPNFPDLVTRVELPTGDVTRFTYDAHGNVETTTVFPDPENDPDGETTTYAYDGAGNLETVTYPDTGVETYGYDDMNRVTLATDPNSTSVIYDYTDNGCGCEIDQITRVTLPNGATLEYDYDGLGRLTEARDQEGASFSYEYDAEGNLLEETRRDGATISYQYDDAGRMRRKELSTGEVMLYEYDAVDRLVNATDSACELDFVYDSESNLIQATTQLDLPVGRTSTRP